MHKKTIAEYDVTELPDRIIFHGTGDLECDLKCALASTGNKLIIFREIFNHYQKSLNKSKEIIALFNRLTAEAIYHTYAREHLAYDFVSIVGPRVLASDLPLDRNLSRQFKACYDEVFKWDGAMAAKIDDDFGGYNNVKKLFVLAGN